MNNYWRTNYVGGQGDEFTFRYVITSGSKLTPGKMSRFGWGQMTPIEVDKISTNDKIYGQSHSANESERSFLNVDSRDVVLINWKRAQDNHGTIMCFMELNGKSENVKINTPLVQLDSVWLCDAMERNKLSLPVSGNGFSFFIKPFHILTIRINRSL